MKKEAGFTMLEVIISLIILGIVSAIVGMGVIAGVQAYSFTRTNAEMTQRAQLALTRMRLEFINMDQIMAYNSDSIQFTSSDVRRNVAASSCFTIARAGTAATVQVGPYDSATNTCSATNPTNSQTNNLLDGLGSYSGGQVFLSYTRNDGAAWAASDGFENLYAIGIQLVMTRPDNMGDFTFTTSVNPRRNGAPNAPKSKD